MWLIWAAKELKEQMKELLTVACHVRVVYQWVKGQVTTMPLMNLPCQMLRLSSYGDPTNACQEA